MSKQHPKFSDSGVKVQIVDNYDSQGNVTLEELVDILNPDTISTLTESVGESLRYFQKGELIEGDEEGTELHVFIQLPLHENFAKRDLLDELYSLDDLGYVDSYVEEVKYHSGELKGYVLTIYIVLEMYDSEDDTLLNLPHFGMYYCNNVVKKYVDTLTKEDFEDENDYHNLCIVLEPTTWNDDVNLYD